MYFASSFFHKNFPFCPVLFSLALNPSIYKTSKCYVRRYFLDALSKATGLKGALPHLPAQLQRCRLRRRANSLHFRAFTGAATDAEERYRFLGWLVRSSDRCFNSWVKCYDQLETWEFYYLQVLILRRLSLYPRAELLVTAEIAALSSQSGKVKAVLGKIALLFLSYQNY